MYVLLLLNRDEGVRCVPDRYNKNYSILTPLNFNQKTSAQEPQAHPRKTPNWVVFLCIKLCLFWVKFFCLIALQGLTSHKGNPNTMVVFHLLFFTICSTVKPVKILVILKIPLLVLCDPKIDCFFSWSTIYRPYSKSTLLILQQWKKKKERNTFFKATVHNVFASFPSCVKLPYTDTSSSVA